jgi:predicted HTH transcriptional regulator
MNPEAIAWLNQFSDIALDDRQRLALVYLHHQQHITNSDYHRLNRIDAMTAGQELRGLVHADLVEQKGTSPWTYYSLKTSEELPEQKVSLTDEDTILIHLREYGSINNKECRQLLDVDEKRAWYLLNKLCKSGTLKRGGKGRWTIYKLL